MTSNLSCENGKFELLFYVVPFTEEVREVVSISPSAVPGREKYNSIRCKQV